MRKRFLLMIFLSLTLLGVSIVSASVSAKADETIPATVVNGRILMFVPYNDVSWTEYKVAYEGLSALGYTVDLVSSKTGEAYAYGGGVDGATQTSFNDFQTLFQTNFDTTWNSAWTSQANIPLNGRIQDIANLDDYDALVIPGGQGAVAYQYDGTYADLSPQSTPGTHVTSAAEVQAAAEKLNDLINIALQAGKPVAAQNHGAPLIAFARINGTAGDGFDNLGDSVLAEKYATGYSGTIATDYANLNVNYLSNEKLVIDGPDAPDYNGNGRDLLVTTVDGYAETAVYFTQTIQNILTTYPAPAERTKTINVLVVGGDEPTNYWPQEPALYTDIADLLNDDGDDLNINAVGTYRTSDLTLANLQNYDVLVYFRHDSISQSRQNDIREFVDNGGGLIGIHHALYNEGNNNGTMVELFGGELPNNVDLDDEMGIVYDGETNHLINVNLGHFVSTYGVHLIPGTPTSTIDYTTPLGIPNNNLDDDNGSGYYHFSIDVPDELYLGNRFNDDVVFGSGVNEVNRLFSNDRYVNGSPNPNNGHYDTSGWVKEYDSDNDEVGRIVYLQPGETNDRTLAHPSYQQVIKNSVVWAASSTSTAPIPNQSPTAVSDEYFLEMNHSLTISAPGVLSNDTDPEDDSLTVTTHDAASNGTLSINSNGSLTYDPDTDFVGQEIINYTISDGTNEHSGTVTIHVWENWFTAFLPIIFR